MKTSIAPQVPSGVELVAFAATQVLALDYNPEALAQAEQKKKSLVRFKRNLLPIENPDPVENQLGQILETTSKMRSQQVITRVFEGKFQLLDPSVFDIRDAQGMPRLMPFKVSVPQSGFIYRTEETTDFTGSRIRNSQQVRCGMFPNFPVHITEHYLDIIERVKIRGQHHVGNARLKVPVFTTQNVELKLITRFGGYIPEEVKWEMVHAWTSRLFQELFIVSEVCDWQENLVVESRQGDPLVVGYDGYQFWLIAAFDTTTLEQAVQDEFCTKVGN
ncbi:MAG: hypothetical protein V4524_00645 [Patescibacteria group bacterium]